MNAIKTAMSVGSILWLSANNMTIVTKTRITREFRIKRPFFIPDLFAEFKSRLLFVRILGFP